MIVSVRAVAASGVAVALMAGLSACSQPHAGSGGSPSAAVSSQPRSSAPAATSSSVPTPTTIVDPVPSNATANDKQVVDLYGQKEANEAMALASSVGQRLATPDTVLGDVKGNDTIGVIADSVDKGLLGRLHKDAKVRDSLIYGNVPFKVVDFKPPTVEVGQPRATTETGDALVTIPVAVYLPITGEGLKPTIAKRSVVLYLARQNDTSEGTWKVTAFSAVPDEFGVTLPKSS